MEGGQNDINSKLNYCLFKIYSSYQLVWGVGGLIAALTFAERMILINHRFLNSKFNYESSIQSQIEDTSVMRHAYQQIITISICKVITFSQWLLKRDYQSCAWVLGWQTFYSIFLIIIILIRSFSGSFSAATEFFNAIVTLVLNIYFIKVSNTVHDELYIKEQNNWDFKS